MPSKETREYVFEVTVKLSKRFTVRAHNLAEAEDIMYKNGEIYAAEVIEDGDGDADDYEITLYYNPED